MKCFVLILLIVISVQSQTPPEPSVADLRRGMTEVRVEMASARAEVKAAVADRLKRENRKLQRRAHVEQKRVLKERARQAYLATLVVHRVEAQSKIKDLQALPESNRALLEALTRRNAALERRIKRANGRFACEVLGLGCVK